MSVQFGMWSLDSSPTHRDALERASSELAPYGPDGEAIYSRANVTIMYRAFHTTKESRWESQPHVSASGRAFTWDGRLDNRTNLLAELGAVRSSDTADVSIVAASYERWGTGCFEKLLGDWALSVWDPNERSLTLAKDPIGTRHLYYAVDKYQVIWSTILDPLVRLQTRAIELDREYIAGWLSFFPAAHLTPYLGIHSVPPSSFAIVREGKVSVNVYWDFDPRKRIRYPRDAEYEEHFRAVFRESVERRLRSDSPVLAELSGGMDSSSIVCVADASVACGRAETPRLDTLSYYNDSEPNWNERPYFARVEEKRGRSGCHIDTSSQPIFRLDFESERLLPTPNSSGRSLAPIDQEFRDSMRSQGNRVVLSGIGGDEVLGGVPTPTPELEDLLRRARLKTLARKLKVWAIDKRRPWLHLLFEAARGFFPAGLVGVPKHRRPPSWLDPGFRKRHAAALAGYEPRLKLFGPLPSFQENLATLDGLRRQLECSALPREPHYEKRYPYLDRSLLEFLYAIPRDQLVRPGQRRSLMRRALVGIVPKEILNRKRKAFMARAPLEAISAEWPRVVEISEHMLMSSLGIIRSSEFREALATARNGQEVPIVSLLRVISIEIWLRNLVNRGVVPIGEHEARNVQARIVRRESTAGSQ
jgi:asparagine synthase (glutamine-hydrolysing)